MVSTRLMLAVIAIWSSSPAILTAADEIALTSRQITFGPQHHFFGYIGHVQNTPWNGDGRYLVALETPFQDRMPGPNDPADIVLIDTQRDHAIHVVAQTRAWNPQQGTMLYWNPAHPDTQFFFNDRDPETGKVFCVLFDIARGERVRAYRDDRFPVGNSGVAQGGGTFLAINYGRLARSRPVTGYKDAFDWTAGVAHPADDGIFLVDVESGKRSLLVSYAQLADALRALTPGEEPPPLFINHTLWNREGDRIFFFARGRWNGERGTRINQPFVIRPDGTGLTPLKDHIGGHPEWDYGHRMIGRGADRQILYDVDRQQVIGTLGSPDIFPNPEGDIALSPDGQWFVNGYRTGKPARNVYSVFRRRDGLFKQSDGFDIGDWKDGDLRLDPAPCWSRDATQIAVPGLDPNDGTRQMFAIDVKVGE